MNNTSNKKNISLIILTIISLVFIFGVYVLNDKILSYSTSLTDDYNKLAELEKEKSVLKNYKNILLAGSSESVHIKKHILTDNRKEVLNFLNELEDYTKRVGINEGNNSPIISVATNDNATLSKYNAGDLNVKIRVYGDAEKIDDFLNLINNIPMISYIDKMDIRFDNVGKKAVNINLIVYQKHESK